MGRGRKVFFVFYLRPLPSPFDSPQLVRFLAVEYGELSVQTIEDVSINNEYEYENDFKPYSYSKSFSQLSMLAMTPSSSL